MSKELTKPVFITSCVESTAEKIHALQAAAKPITWRTIRRALGPQLDRWAKEHGYETDSRRGLTLAKDFAVRFYRSVYDGMPAWVVEWSRIEFVWCPLATEYKGGYFLAPNGIAKRAAAIDVDRWVEGYRSIQMPTLDAIASGHGLDFDDMLKIGGALRLKMSFSYEDGRPVEHDDLVTAVRVLKGGDPKLAKGILVKWTR